MLGQILGIALVGIVLVGRLESLSIDKCSRGNCNYNSSVATDWVITRVIVVDSVEQLPQPNWVPVILGEATEHWKTVGATSRRATNVNFASVNDVSIYVEYYDLLQPVLPHYQQERIDAVVASDLGLDWNFKCPYGYVSADGGSSTIPGGLNTEAPQQCRHIGLCVKKVPLHRLGDAVHSLTLSLHSHQTLPKAPDNRRSWLYGDTDIYGECNNQSLSIMYLRHS